MIEYMFVTKVYEPLLKLTGKPLRVYFKVLPKGTDELFYDDDEFCVLHGELDWQNGVSLFQTECIEPGDWSKIMSCGLDAIKACKEIIDPETYCSGDPE